MLVVFTVVTYMTCLVSKKCLLKIEKNENLKHVKYLSRYFDYLSNINTKITIKSKIIDWHAVKDKSNSIEEENNTGYE